MIVFLQCKRLSEGADIVEKIRDRRLEEKLFAVAFLLDGSRKLQVGLWRVEFELFLALGFESFGGRHARGLPLAFSAFIPLDHVAAGPRAPLDPPAGVAVEGYVFPPGFCFNLACDIDAAHRCPPRAGWTL